MKIMKILDWISLAANRTTYMYLWIRRIKVGLSELKVTYNSRIGKTLSCIMPKCSIALSPLTFSSNICPTNFPFRGKFVFRRPPQPADPAQPLPPTLSVQSALSPFRLLKNYAEESFTLGEAVYQAIMKVGADGLRGSDCGDIEKKWFKGFKWGLSIVFLMFFTRCMLWFTHKQCKCQIL